MGQSQEAEATYRAGLTCAAEPDVKTRLLVELGIRAEDLRERAALLREARDLRGNLIAAAQATLALKASAPSA